MWAWREDGLRSTVRGVRHVVADHRSCEEGLKIEKRTARLEDESGKECAQS